MKTYVTTGSKASGRSTKSGPHTTNPTSSSGNKGAKMGQDSLHGAQGSRGKYC